MKVLITRPRAQSAEFGAALQLSGFEPVYFPVIEISPMEDLSALEDALAHLDRYAWLVLTSANGVEILFAHIASATGRLALPGDIKIAAVGKKTTEALRKRGIEPFFVPEEFTGAEIAPGLGDLRGKWVLLPRAEIARPELPNAILAAGGIAHEIAIYRTLPAQVDADGLDALRAGVDWVTFTSPSTVQNFAEICRQHGLDPLNLPGQAKIACIGPVTEKAARQEGFVVDVVAAEYTTEGLVRVVSKQVNR
jgi:uroporphyrinogen III methyltransferase / synthase